MSASIGASTADAQPGGGFPIDPTFATGFDPSGVSNGWENRPREVGAPSEVGALVATADGGILVAWVAADPNRPGPGTRSFPSDNRVTKLLANGSVDVSFGALGPTPGTVDVAPEGVLTLALDSRGRILAGGNSLVQRLLPDGSPDPTFMATCIRPCAPGNGLNPPLTDPGVVGVTGRVASMWAEPDNSVVVTSFDGQAGTITKLTPTGDRDLAFNPAGDGVRSLAADQAGPAVRLADGSILVVSVVRPTLRRFRPDGSLDAFFGNGAGQVPIVTGDPDLQVFLGVQLDGRGRLLVDLVSGANTRLLARLSVEGVLDRAFGNNGRLDVRAFGDDAFMNSVTPLADGRLLLVFRSGRAGYESAIARLTESGQLDASFRSQDPAPGWLALAPTTYPVIARPLLVQPSRVVVGGAWLWDGTSGIEPRDSAASVVAFLETAGPPRPVDPYPIWSPPPVQPPRTIGAAAVAHAQAVRLRLVPAG